MKSIPAALLKSYYQATAEERRRAIMAHEAAARRAQALLAVHDQGYSYGDIAHAVNLSRAMVQKLIERARKAVS